ncbi:MAG: hypothetical protein DME20_09980 [Verrucomicrobia bacterium]|nr:MAG: hypothetical protein DME20_09980 [Verrucomicrobiota bacterium]
MRSSTRKILQSKKRRAAAFRFCLYRIWQPERLPYNLASGVMTVSDTIAAVSTPPGEGAIALVRLSGANAIQIADKIFRGKELPSQFASHMQHLGEIFSANDQLIDQVVLSIHRAPASYTAEDLVEISCHGGTLVSAKVLEACLRAGARAARPGEFTERAFLNGKMDLTQAEAVIDLIRARTDLALRSATEQLEGRLGDQIRKIRDELIALPFGARMIEVPSPGYEQDLEAMLEAVTPKTRLIFIPNPNNPTGTLISQRAIDSFVSRVPQQVMVVFDEAYFEFLDDPPDTLQFVREGRNVIVLRTFSKIHGLAGLRIGYAVAQSDVIDVLHRTRQPFNVNSIAQAGALAALEDDAHLRETKRVIDEGRAYLQEQFAEMKVPFVPGVANFVMVNVGDGCAVFEKLLRRKIIVRSLKGYGLPEWVRISVGTMEQSRELIAALKDMMRAQ